MNHPNQFPEFAGPPYQLPPAGTQEPLPPSSPPQKKKRWPWIIGIPTAVIIGLIAIGNTEDGSAPTATPQPTSATSSSETFEPTEDVVTEDPTVEEPEPTKAPEPTFTRTQEQAIGQAKDYLDYSHFSKKGLIEQLEYEGFSTKNATFAVNYIKVNWNEQAAGKAEEYLDYGHFSRSGLIEQLEYEGFTHSQAVYGVDKAGL